jgi:hypothetical protein
LPLDQLIVRNIRTKFDDNFGFLMRGSTVDGDKYFNQVDVTNWYPFDDLLALLLL